MKPPSLLWTRRNGGLGPAALIVDPRHSSGGAYAPGRSSVAVERPSAVAISSATAKCAAVVAGVLTEERGPSEVALQRGEAVEQVGIGCKADDAQCGPRPNRLILE